MRSWPAGFSLCLGRGWGYRRECNKKPVLPVGSNQRLKNEFWVGPSALLRLGIDRSETADVNDQNWGRNPTGERECKGQLGKLRGNSGKLRRMLPKSWVFLQVPTYSLRLPSKKQQRWPRRGGSRVGGALWLSPTPAAVRPNQSPRREPPVPLAHRYATLRPGPRGSSPPTGSGPPPAAASGGFPTSERPGCPALSPRFPSPAPTAKPHSAASRKPTRKRKPKYWQKTPTRATSGRNFGEREERALLLACCGRRCCALATPGGALRKCACTCHYYTYKWTETRNLELYGRHASFLMILSYLLVPASLVQVQTPPCRTFQLC